VIVCAGGCGARTAQYLLDTDEELLIIGSELDLQFVERTQDDRKVMVDAGDPRGGYKDYRRTIRKIRKDLKPIVSSLQSWTRETKKAPVVVFGLGGAVGLATAGILADAVPVVAMTVLPDSKEAVAAEAVERFDFLLGRKKAVLVHAFQNPDCGDVSVLRDVAVAATQWTGKTVDTIVNADANRDAYLDGDLTTVDELRGFLKGLAPRRACVVKGSEEPEVSVKVPARTATNGGGDQGERKNRDLLDLL